ncbi:mannosyltransferase B [Pandoraea sp. SD6-2]|uniref:mannosyltransferase B n=1 Tax=Pandoraea sp. SD6-2 TaxID=1286093 RepID=UPI000330B5CF|nr:mannosyltransferase B [Pandoraea sp. SD6-2]EON11205.1 mannosyltransferase B [Pandoraea sp. SD6-2]
MSESKVLITTYPTAFLHRGGGELELVDLLANLRLLEVKADLYGPTSQPLDRYDVVLHYSVMPTGIDFVRAVKAAGKKLVLMPGLWWTGSPGGDEKSCTAEFFELADVIVFKSRSEYENVAGHVMPAASKVVYCRWGVDSCFEESVDRHLFRKTHRLGDYLLSLGMVEESKNQLTAIRALRDSQIPLVIVGDYRDRDYYEACVKVAPSHFKFLPHLVPKSEMLRSALHGAKAFIEVSLEPPGFSSFEAALSCVPLVLSAGPWTAEHFDFTLVHHVDPLSTESIRAGVTAALNTPVSRQLRCNVHNRHLMPQCLEPLARVLRVRP